MNNRLPITWNQGCATTRQKLVLQGNGSMLVHTFTVFTDNSGRADYAYDEGFVTLCPGRMT